MSPSSKNASLVARLEIDDEVALQRIRDPEERVDPRWTASPLEAGNRGLRRPDELGQLTLGQSAFLPPFGDLLCNRSEEPASVGGANSLL
jgi:hypothetical protein